MRKLIAVLCIVAMLVMAVPAFANPSVAGPVVTTTEGVIITPLDEEDPAKDIEHEDVKGVVEAVNGEGYMTPTEVVEALPDEDEEKQAEKLEEVKDYSFSSQFFHIWAPEFPVDVTFEGTVVNQETDQNTKVMLIDPKTSELVIILPNADGSYTFPFSGIFALIDPTPVEVEEEVEADAEA